MTDQEKREQESRESVEDKFHEQRDEERQRRAGLAGEIQANELEEHEEE